MSQLISDMPRFRPKLILLAATIPIWALSACGGMEAPSPSREKPNIVLIMTDDQGWAQLGSHGNELIRTPRLDAFASQSVELIRFYVSPVCAPTRASLMTGRYNYRTGVVDTYIGRAMMHADETTVAEMLSAAGYKTGIFGKWHLGDNHPMRAFEQGFQETLIHKGGGIGQPSDPPGTGYFDPILQHNGKEEQHKGYCTDIFFDAAIKYAEASRNDPFFIYIPTNAPHSPYDVADSYIEPYKAMGLNDKDARIYGMITNIDENFGRLLDKLDELQLAKDTIVIFMTDNGPTTQHFTAGLHDQKASVYEGGIRVPFFLRWPEKLRPAKLDQIAAHIDVTPTLLEMAGVEKPANVKFDGMSLLPLLRGETAGWPQRTLFIQSHRGNTPQLYRNFAAITQQYKLMQPLSFSSEAPPNAPLLLFDIQADPGERQNLAGEKPEVTAELKAAYEKWFADVSSTRGYEPPKIQIGTEFENPVTLTRQDWRMVGPDGWGDESLGFWEVDVKSANTYEVTLRFPEQPRAGTVSFALGAAKGEQKFEKGATSAVFAPVKIATGAGRLEASLKRSDATVGVSYVDVKQLN